MSIGDFLCPTYRIVDAAYAAITALVTEDANKRGELQVTVPMGRVPA
jgi:hypothetical protein